MAMRIVLKHSSAENALPSATQLPSAGEIALNYNGNNAFLTCLDSSGDIHQIGGIKVGASAPTTPAIAAMWLDTAGSDNILKVWDGSVWQEVSGSGGDFNSGPTPPGSGNSIGDVFFDTTNIELVYWDGAAWQPIGGGDVTSVFGRTGAVVAAEGDYDLDLLGDVSTAGAVDGSLLQYTAATGSWGPGSPGAVVVNLDYTNAPNQGTITNDSGTNAVIPLANGTNAGLTIENFTTAEKDKLGLIDVGAEANPDAGRALTYDTGTTPDTLNVDIASTAQLGVVQIGNGLTINGAGLLSADAATVDVDLGYTTDGLNAGTVTNTAGDDATIPIATTTTAGLFAEKAKLDGIAPGAEVNVDVDLGYTAAADKGTITNTAGTDAEIPLADSTNAGLFTAAEKTKLSGIEAGAEKNVDVDLGYTAAADKGTVTNTAGDNAVLPLADGTNAGLTIENFTTALKDKLNNLDDIDVSPTPPSSPNAGDLWIDTAECPPELKIWDDCSDPGNPSWTPIGGVTPPATGTIDKPTISTPADRAGIDDPALAPNADDLEFTSSVPSGTNITTYGNATWEVDTDSLFGSPMTATKTITAGVTQALLPSERGAITLADDTEYHVRVKYDSTDPAGVESQYSDANQFKTAAASQDDWNLESSGIASQWQDVAFGNGVFVAVAFTGTDRVMYSSDGISWTGVDVGTDMPFQSVAFGNNRFVAVANSGSERAMYSTDGINWTKVAAISETWVDVKYIGPSGNKKFVACAPGVGTYDIMHSSDGSTWTGASTGSLGSALQAVAYGDTKYVAVTQNQFIYQSTDLTTWTQLNKGDALRCTDVVFANTKFVAIGITEGGPVLYSANGTDWSAGTGGQFANALVYGDSKFVAVSAYLNNFMYSADGENWSLVAAPKVASWSGVAYGNGIFVAVANTNTGTDDVGWSETGKGDPAFFRAYDADNNKPVNDLNIVDRFGVDPTADNTHLGIYELTEQPTEAVAAYVPDGDKYKPIIDLSQPLEQAQAEAAQANARLDEANATIEEIRADFEARIAALENP